MKLKQSYLVAIVLFGATGLWLAQPGPASPSHHGGGARDARPGGSGVTMRPERGRVSIDKGGEDARAAASTAADDAAAADDNDDVYGLPAAPARAHRRGGGDGGGAPRTPPRNVRPSHPKPPKSQAKAPARADMVENRRHGDDDDAADDNAARRHEARRDSSERHRDDERGSSRRSRDRDDEHDGRSGERRRSSSSSSSRRSSSGRKKDRRVDLRDHQGDEFYGGEVKVRKDYDAGAVEMPSERYAGPYDALRGRHSDSRIVENFRRPSFKPHAQQVTLYTQLSCTPHNRLVVMRQLIRRWRGPASVAVYIMSDEDEAAVTKLYDNDATLRKYASLHLVYMSAETRDHHLRAKYGIQMVYPINTLRNVAWTNALSKWVLHVDVDFRLYPERESYYSNLIAYEMYGENKPAGELTMPAKTAFVIAAFEMDPDELAGPIDGASGDAPLTVSEVLNGDFDEEDAPADEEEHARAERHALQGKKALEALYFSGNTTTQVFAQNLCTSCHEFTWYERWFSTERSYVIEYGAGYEPYTIVPSTAPLYDEWFTGRHLNKNMHVWDLACDDYMFVVLRQPFVLHANKHRIIPYVKEDYVLMEKNWIEHQAARWSVCISGMEFNRRFWRRELRPDYWRRKARDNLLNGRLMHKLAEAERKAHTPEHGKAEAPERGGEEERDDSDEELPRRRRPSRRGDHA